MNLDRVVHLTAFGEDTKSEVICESILFVCIYISRYFIVGFYFYQKLLII